MDDKRARLLTCCRANSIYVRSISFAPMHGFLFVLASVLSLEETLQHDRAEMLPLMDDRWAMLWSFCTIEALDKDNRSFSKDAFCPCARHRLHPDRPFCSSYIFLATRQLGIPRDFAHEVFGRVLLPFPRSAHVQLS